MKPLTKREIFFEALEMPTPESREAYLQAACGGDVVLRCKIDGLLKEHFSDDSLLAGPPWQAWSAPSWEEIKAAGAKEKTEFKQP